MTHKDYEITKIQITQNQMFYIFGNYYWWTMTFRVNVPITDRNTVVL